MSMICSVGGCTSVARGRGMCNLHRLRVKRNGDPLVVKRRPQGAGTIASGYVYHSRNGVKKAEHVEIAERALGRPLKNEELVHHGDGVRLNNDNGNLIICPNKAYHFLLHRRMRARDACGNPDWRKCEVCHGYDDPMNMWVLNEGRARHRACFTEYQRAYAAGKRAKVVVRA